MTILVTGGCGLVGSFAVREAAARGVPVAAFDMVLKTELLADIRDKVTLMQGNVLHAPDLYRAVRELDVTRILHTASFLTPGAYARPYANAELTIMGTLNVLECARAMGIKRVSYVSTGKTGWTGAAFSGTLNTGKFDIPADPYASAKVGAELLANDYRQLYDLDVRILRLGGQVYGPGYAFAGAVGQGLQPFIEKPLRGEPVRYDNPLLAYSAPIIPMLYGADAGRGCMTATLAADLPHVVYDINAPVASTLYQVVQAIKALIPGADIEVPEAPTEAGPFRAGPIAPDPRAQADFGYLPEYDLMRGLREYIAFVKTGRYAVVS
ncbi:NAD(P)-dependent oxidoreductase [Immundisolibacter sp.]|uniref:NAD-dependent epimerase/dehydratase family protein n=1 Tax=Immundisolibacter sp. TaxID=1934948 RepID=UPI002B0CE690|nr:NAD(P)-dependent oxidoreductase [Immundisolibacter sp.]MEA3219040.1 GDP-mannose 4,6-dehydratase [Immundisolibacter sp.]